eukprot:SAG22_NODE_166_length_16765_cov_30.782791_3_plen_189_part_00
MSVIRLSLRYNTDSEVIAESGAMSVIWLLWRHSRQTQAARSVFGSVRHKTISHTSGSGVAGRRRRTTCRISYRCPPPSMLPYLPSSQSRARTGPNRSVRPDFTDIYVFTSPDIQTSQIYIFTHPDFTDIHFYSSRLIQTSQIYIFTLVDMSRASPRAVLHGHVRIKSSHKCSLILRFILRLINMSRTI